MSKSAPGEPRWDPVYLNSLRELRVIILLFSIFFLWALTVCYFDGYRGSEAGSSEPAMVLGVPRWAFWGVLVPWLMVDVAAVWFCFWYMADDDLGEAHEGQDLVEQVEHLHDAEHRNEEGHGHD